MAQRNPEYNHLAHRRTIVTELHTHLREKFMALSSPEPEKTLVCEEVLHQDSNVPVEEVQAVVDELEQEGEALRIQMMQYSFNQQEENNGLLSSKKSTKKTEQGTDRVAKKAKSTRRRK